MMFLQGTVEALDCPGPLRVRSSVAVGCAKTKLTYRGPRPPLGVRYRSKVDIRISLEYS